MAILRMAAFLILEIMQWAILARVLFSWLPISKDNPIAGLLYQITEPILSPIRGILERVPFTKNIMMDLSPIAAFLILSVIESIL